MTEQAALLATRIRDLSLRIEGSPLEGLVQRLYGELEARGLRWRPRCYLGDEWGCPDALPIISIPLTLADERLRELERERSGMVEGDAEILRALRHEAGHAFNYAYRLYATEAWRLLFGDFGAPYRDPYRVDPFDDRFVRCLPGWYGQKHPDEDFAETFAVWLNPEHDWRRRYAGWRAQEKIEYVDRVAAELRDTPPTVVAERPVLPIEEMDATLEEYYRSRRGKRPLPGDGFFDDELRRIFDVPTGPDDLRPRAADRMARWTEHVVSAACGHSGEWSSWVAELWALLRRRASALDLRVAPEEEPAALASLTALVTATVIHRRWTEIAAP